MRIATVLGLLALGAASAAGWAYVAPTSAPTGQGKSTSVVTTQAKTPWVAAAPGRVEPRSGVIRISAGLPGRITDVFVKVNDKVVEGEVLEVSLPVDLGPNAFPPPLHELAPTEQTQGAE